MGQWVNEMNEWKLKFERKYRFSLFEIHWLFQTIVGLVLIEILFLE